MNSRTDAQPASADPAIHTPRQVYGRDGFHGMLARAPLPGEQHAELTLDGGHRLLVRTDLLEPRPDGAYTVPFGPDDLRGGELIGHGVESAVFPVIEERAEIGKRQVETGRVAVHIVPRTRTEVVSVPMSEEHAVIQRVPVNRVVERAEPVRREGDVTVIPVYEEIVVVERRLVLKEEIRIGLEKRTRQEQQAVEVRTEEVRIERTDPQAPTTHA